MSEKNIKIFSLNCRGLSKDKIIQLRYLFEKFKIDILFLQETHFNKPVELSCLKESFNDCQIFCPLSENKTKGVGLIIKENFYVNNLRFYENRIVSVKIEFFGKIFTLINVYVPNTPNEQIEFICNTPEVTTRVYMH